MTATRKPMYCTGCGNEIDPTTCHCGSNEFWHRLAVAEHQFVPMGCDCLRDDFAPNKDKVIIALRIAWQDAVAENEKLRKLEPAALRALALLRRVRQIAIEGFHESEWREVHRYIHQALEDNLNEDRYIAPITEP